MFVPLTDGAVDTVLQTFVARLVLASSVKPVKFVAHHSTTFVFALSRMFKSGGVATCEVRNAFRTDS